MGGSYVLALEGAERSERQRLELVERFHDPITVPVLEARGVGAGWHCLDVGAGAGSIARWLAARVGRSGAVVATDLDTRLLAPAAAVGVEIRRHDLLLDRFEPDAYDLVHARLVLIHVPDRAEALTRLAAATRPGGWVVVGDIDFTPFAPREPWPGWAGVWESFLLITRRAGWDVACGSRLAEMLDAASLVGVEDQSVGHRVRGGGLVCQIMARTLERLGDRLAAAGVPETDLETSRRELMDPTRAFTAPTVWTAWGRRR